MRSLSLPRPLLPSLAALALAASGCATGAAPPSTSPMATADLADDDDSRVGRYTSSPWGFSTNSWWIEGDDGVVVIDTQFLPSAAEELVSRVKAETGKPIVLAVVLHPNPDKFNGTAVLERHGARVITSAQVAALLPSVHEKRVGWFYERYQPDYPRELTLPEVFGAETTSLDVAGLHLTLHVLPGPGCSAAHLAVEWEGHVFVGDLVASGTHAWLEIGESEEWLHRLAELEALQPRAVHPGRGPAGGRELLGAQATYLRRVQEQVAALHPRGEPPEGALEGVARDLEAAYPGYRFGVFLRLGLPAEWRRQAALAAPKDGSSSRAPM